MALLKRILLKKLNTRTLLRRTWFKCVLSTQRRSILSGGSRTELLLHRSDTSCLRPQNLLHILCFEDRGCSHTTVGVSCAYPEAPSNCPQVLVASMLDWSLGTLSVIQWVALATNTRDIIIARQITETTLLSLWSNSKASNLTKIQYAIWIACQWMKTCSYSKITTRCTDQGKGNRTPKENNPQSVKCLKDNSKWGFQGNSWESRVYKYKVMKKQF